MRTTSDAAPARAQHDHAAVGLQPPGSANNLGQANLGEANLGQASEANPSADLVKAIAIWLDEAKAENIVTIDLKGKSTIGDFMMIASGRNDRHVGGIADMLQKKLREYGAGKARVEGLESCDWVLIDNGDVIVHVFRPEVRDFYKLEKMWSGDRPVDETTH
ncbi:MAG: ribosome silencing factor [Hyphomicrobium aestuarii]|nr:ribosome silencing factor [Hyphomicrobium aestuarii]